jgi:hypothetical protein
VQASDRFRGGGEGGIAGCRVPAPAGLDELNLVRVQAAHGRHGELTAWRADRVRLGDRLGGRVQRGMLGVHAGQRGGAIRGPDVRGEDLNGHRAGDAVQVLGLVRHMTEVERWWFRIHAADTDMAFPHDPDQAGQDFEALDDVDAAASIEAFKQEIAQARAAVAGRQLDDVVPSHGHHRERTRDIRWIYLHMIEEYARHNGHADLIRERIDGVTGD